MIYQFRSHHDPFTVAEVSLSEDKLSNQSDLVSGLVLRHTYTLLHPAAVRADEPDMRAVVRAAYLLLLCSGGLWRRLHIKHQSSPCHED